jgi:hypothetical protein
LSYEKASPDIGWIRPHGSVEKIGLWEIFGLEDSAKERSRMLKEPPTLFC